MLQPQQGDQAGSDHLRLPMRSAMPEADIKEVVRERYAKIARNVGASGSSCCYDDELGSEGTSANLYAADETKCLPQDAVTASLGCGNPTALAELKESETVLELGSGGGIGVLLSNKRFSLKMTKPLF
jgi:arsenite methyltransferase